MPRRATIKSYWMTYVAAGAALGLLTAALASGQARAETFGYTGGPQSYNVPSGFGEMRIVACGAQGGAGGGQLGTPPGGLGGRSTAVLKVSGNETLQIYVGGKGADGVNGEAPPPAGGFNGGGDGGGTLGGPTTDGTGGAGGGASDVRQGGATLLHRVVVAGGGGGGGASGGAGGAGGGTTGAAGIPSAPAYAAQVGQPGTQTAGGAGGYGGGSNFAQAGTLGSGGDGESTTSGSGQGGGGGGGGYFGGGGAWQTDSPGAGGGGGGSGLAAGGAQLETGACQGNGSISVEPTNTFTLGKIRVNKRKGTATQILSVPNAGVVKASGKGVKSSSASAAVKVTSPGKVRLKISAKGKKRKQLEKNGKVRLKLKLAYTPTGGETASLSRKLTLKQKRR